MANVYFPIHTTAAFMRRRQPVSDAIYIQLFRITCTGQVPTLIISVLFAQIAIIVSSGTHDLWVQIASIAGILISLLRLLFMFFYLRSLRVEIDNMEAVKRADKIYVAGSLAFAATLGFIGMRTFQIAPQDMELLVTALLLGYAAGMVTRGFALFWNCNVSLCLASVPVIIASAWHGNSVYSAL
jgi:hypothetical protein